jgi:hypothetical protein
LFLGLGGGGGGGGAGGGGGGGGFINALFVEMMKWDENVQLHTCKNKKMVSMKGM